MAKATRKQPAFDPNELEDLIFSPAVGNGVGSHLVTSSDSDSPAPLSPTLSIADVTTVATPNLTTVVTSNEPVTRLEPNPDSAPPITVGSGQLATVVTPPPSESTESDDSVVNSVMPTVAVPQRTTVDETAPLPASGAVAEPSAASAAMDSTTVAVSDQPTVDTDDLTAIAPSDLSTSTADIHESVVASVPSTVAVPQRTTVDNSHDSTVSPSAVWFTETGEVVPKARVRPVRTAMDVLNPAEQAVYTMLWDAGAAGSADARLSQAGYHDLVLHTGFSKRTIQRIIERLIDKDFIAIDQPADIYRRTSTVYRVFSTSVVLERHQEKGRLHVAKLGPGYSYVRSLPWNHA